MNGTQRKHGKIVGYVVECEGRRSTVGLACHDELSHGEIPKGTLHFCGNGHEGLTPRQRSGLGRTGG